MTLTEMFKREHGNRHAKRDMTPLANGATADQIADVLADQAGNREHGKTRDSLKAKWITSDKFVPMTLPTDLLQPVDIPGKRDKPSRTVGPIVLEANFRGREQEHDGEYNGKVPPVFIIDGQHRHAEALTTGQPTMRCLVGVKAVSAVHAEMIRREGKRRYAKFVESEHPRASDGEFTSGGGEAKASNSESDVKKIVKALVGPQTVTQKRAKSGGEEGPNGEWYPGGAFIATTDMPKRVKQKIDKAAQGKVQVDGYKWEVPKPGQMSILNKLGGTVMNHRNGEINYKYLEWRGTSESELKMYQDIAAKWMAGERWVSVNDYPNLANLDDAARLAVAGEAIPGAVLDKFPEDWRGYFAKYKPRTDVAKLCRLLNVQRYKFRESQHPRDASGEFTSGGKINQTSGKVPGTIAPVDELTPKPLKPLAGQRSMFAEQLNSAFNERLGIKVPAKAKQKSLFRRSGPTVRYRESEGSASGRWITIGAGDGGHGTHVKVSGGRIVTGPPGITGKKLDELPDRSGSKTTKVSQKKKPSALPGWKEFRLKSESATKPNPNKAKQKELGLKAEPKVGPGVAKVRDLHVNPEKFQYKLNTSPRGVTSQFSDIKFNPEFSGTLHVWQDPEDGKTYVVNGHHRHELAERSGYKGDLQVHYLKAKNAEEARAKGALINIAGGNGTAVDASKFMRDTGTTADEMKQHGVSLKGQVAKDAATLSKLSPGIFRRVALGTYRTGRALAIAEHLPEHADQDRLDHYIEKYEESKGRELSDSTVDEMARDAARASRQQSTTKGLFGEETEDRSLFVERAELKGALRREITGRLNKFRAVASEKAASTLEGSNKINAAENKKTADRLANFLDDFDRETSYKGPVSDRLNEASQELAHAPGKKKQIIDRLTADIRSILETVPEAYGEPEGGMAEGSGGSGEEPGKQVKPAGGQRGFFSRHALVSQFERAIYGRSRKVSA